MIVHIFTRPSFPDIDWGVGVVAILIGGAGFILSAIGYSQSYFAIEFWWAPFGFALVIGSLAPYLPMFRLLILGGAGTLVFVSAAFLEVHDRVLTWGPVSTYIIILIAPISGLAAADDLLLCRGEPDADRARQALGGRRRASPRRGGRGIRSGSASRT